MEIVQWICTAVEYKTLQDNPGPVETPLASPANICIQVSTHHTWNLLTGTENKCITCLKWPRHQCRKIMLHSINRGGHSWFYCVPVQEEWWFFFCVIISQCGESGVCSSQIHKYIFRKLGAAKLWRLHSSDCAVEPWYQGPAHTHSHVLTFRSNWTGYVLLLGNLQGQRKKEEVRRRRIKKKKQSVS